MKNKFIFVTAIICAFIFTMSAFAADTWKFENEKWYCMDKDGNTVYGEVKKSGDNYYFLDEATGEMVTNRLVEVEGNKYWFGEDGAKVINKWVKVPVDTDVDEAGYKWMYFNSVSGKATIGEAGKFYTINGKKYAFNSEGQMLYGYLTDMFDKATNVLDAVYYMGTKDEGWQYTGWQKFENGAIDAPGYDDKALVYFYFKNGKKVTNSTLDGYKIDGVKYYFNEDGSMFSGYVATASNVYYLGKNDDGTMKKKQWVKTNAIDTTTDNEYWYYLGANGAVTVGTGDNGNIKKINGKYYWIAKDGKMKTGLAVVTMDNYQGLNNPAEEAHVITDIKFANVDALKKYVLADKNYIYYFSTDADNDGALKTGAVTVTLDDEEVTVNFDKHGVALEGVVKNKVYNNGILKTGVGVAKCNKDGEYYLVNAAGTILKKTVAKDSDGAYWAVDEDNNIATFVDQDYAGKAANAWKNGEDSFIVGNTTYTFTYEQKDGYVRVRYKK